ncbi:MAG: carboxypeptidase regulatory-like domain-containing protein [Treponema sp.]|nr:carboxypeptidase regulatory-like domain-containing protein [Treponema sp.]
MKKYLWLLLLNIVFISCSSTKYFKEKVDLCGLVVDENNQPIPYFEMTCIDSKGTIEYAITNENGIFVFQNKKSGSYVLNGKKNGWTKLTDKKINFIDYRQMTCCKVWSIEKTLETVKQMIFQKDYEAAFFSIDKIYVDEMSLVEITVLFHKVFLLMKMNEKEKSKFFYEKLLFSVKNQEKDNYFRNEIDELQKLLEWRNEE